MLNMSFLLWTSLVAAIAGAFLANANGIREDIAVVRICNATDPVDLGIFNAYMMHHDLKNLGDHSRELSCFLLCIYNEYKWMNLHGGFRLHRIKSWMRRANLRFDDEEFLLHKCITLADVSDPCTRARHFTECFWSNHQAGNSLDDSGHTFHAIIRKKDVE